MESDRDFKEERENAMIPFHENCELVFERGYTMDQLLEYARTNPDKVTLTQVHDEVCISLDLIEAPNGALYRMIKDD